MFIIEGPDGAGKTTLIQRLHTELGYPIQERVVSKDTQALVDLRVWSIDNLTDGFVPKLFDRHRLISDPVYRFSIPGKDIPESLYDAGWLNWAYKKFMEVDPVVIFCLPPLEIVATNLIDDPHNRVVADHIEKIYRMYALEYARYKYMSPLTDVLLYDYTTDDLETLIAQVKEIATNV